MAKRIANGEKKKPHSFSIETKIWDDMNDSCSTLDTTSSAELQKFVRKFLRKNKEIVEKVKAKAERGELWEGKKPFWSA